MTSDAATPTPPALTEDQAKARMRMMDFQLGAQAQYLRITGLKNQKRG